MHSYNPHTIGTKLYDLYEDIKKDKNLKYLLYDDERNEYYHIYSCIIKTRKYPFLNDYVDEYFNVYPYRIKMKNNKGETVLMSASDQTLCSDEIVKILLKHKADPNIQNYDGWTSLMQTILCKGTVENVELLLENGANVNVQNNGGMTALMLTIQLNFTNALLIVDLLLKYGANVNMRNNGGMTALMLTVKFNFSNALLIVVLLLKYGANVNIKDEFLNTALIYACQNKYNELIVKLLLKNGANVNDQDQYGMTALMHASYIKKVNNVCKILLDNKANVNIQDNDGWTALMYFVTDLDDLKNIMLYIPDISLKNNSGEDIFGLIRKYEKYASTVNIILPTRKQFLLNVNRLNKTKLFKFKSYDFKISCTMTICFVRILMHM